MSRCDGGLVGARRGDDVDGVELADLAEERPGRWGRRTRPGWRRPGCRPCRTGRYRVMVKVRVGPGSRMRTCSPTPKSYFCAVPASMTTSCGVVGGVPCDDAQRGELRFRVEGEAERGRPAAGDGLAVTGDELGVPVDRALGRLDARDARDGGEDRLGDGVAHGVAAAAETGPRRGPGSRRSGRCSPNSVSNVLCSVSVSTNVPEMNVTPSTMASAVSARRSLWASRPLMVTFHMSAAQRPHPLEDRIRRRVGQLADHLAVGQEHDPVGVRGAARVVGHHDDRLAELRDRACAGTTASPPRRSSRGSRWARRRRRARAG